jgi:serine/threonine protein kinase
MKRCTACLAAIPADVLSCPSCGLAPSGALSDESLLLGRLAEEFTRAAREGKPPDVEEYAGEYPEIGVRIRELFPTLLALEDAAKARGRGGGIRTEKDSGVNPPNSPSTLSPSHFVAGTPLSSRYRIIGLLRRGGMGEVWRADDLKLGQEVALKFLPAILSEDAAALARFHREVAFARNVSHPNICRVFDIDEVDGRSFLSMEYIDGEDLSSLLRRVGRLPHAKGVEIALQLCNGLAAAHENNVLHCDLKPSNVMVDGRGRARITDFGLACPGDEASRDRVRAGTLAYMAPEQIEGDDVSTKSDVYSLGLVFFEIFTGKRAYQAETLSGLKLLQKCPAPRPSKIAPDIDPAIERLIMRCLQKNPDLRPSLHQISSMLSGGDPIALALAAGELPSPEMVAASPGADTVKPRVAFVYLGLFFAGLLIIVLLSGVGLLHREVPFQKSPTVLADRAASIAQSFGYYDMPKDVAYGFERDDEYLEYVARTDASPDRWSRLYTGRPAALYFWYRQSPVYLVARSQAKITPEDPPQVQPGMATVFLDTKGRLIGFTGIPDSSAAKGKETNWQALFENAGLSMDDFRQVPPKGSLVPACDVHVAWDGHFLEQPDLPIHIEAASLRGSPVFFDISGWEPAAPGSSVPPDGRTGFPQGTESRTLLTFGFTVFMVGIVSGALLARRNIWLGRGDRKGATRLGLYMVAVQMLAWLFQTHHVPMVAELELLYTGLAWAIFYAVVLWILYVALEPYVRRRWPYRIISWSRLLSGRLHDEIVGRDILIGASLGTACIAIASVAYLVMRSAGIPPDKPPTVALDTFLGPPKIFAQFLSMQRECVTDPLYVLLTILVLSGLLRRDWRAFAAVWIAFTFGAGMLSGIQQPANWIVVGTVVAAYLAVFARFGLLATIIFQFCAFMLLKFPLTANFKTWYAGTTMFVALVTTGLACYGFFSAISGRAAFRRSYLRE